jgi:parallel beta-helix repeat protein
LKLKLLALIVAVLVALPSVAEAQAPTRDSVRGAAIVDQYQGFEGPSGTYVTVNAESNADGTSPSGEVGVLVNCDLSGASCSSNFNAAGGRVTCLNVNGNRAVIGYYGDRRGISSSPDVRVRGLIEIIDNGQGTATSPRDSLSNRTKYIDFFFPNTPDVPITNCPDLLPSEPGNFREFESGPLPPALQPAFLNSPQEFTVIDADPVIRCGQVITEDTKLENDLLDCPGNGLVIGADDITLDLNGHTIDGLRRAEPCEPDCLHGRGIDNTGGYDDLRVVNGTVTDFERGVILVRATNNHLSRLSVHARATREVFSPVTLIRSDHNSVVDSVMGAGEPAVLLFLSDHNAVARNRMSGGISIRQGDGIALVQADHNRIVDNEASGDGFGARVEDSLGNRLARNAFGGYAGVFLSGVRNTDFVGNVLSNRGGLWVVGDANRILRNTLLSEGGIGLSGDHNRVERNVKSAGQSGIGIGSGAGNLVRRNQMAGVGTGIYVGPTAASARVVGNTATSNAFDGIEVAAAGTLLKRNTSNNNGQLGINAVPGVIDGGGNRASGNGNPLQCVNVFCQ